MHWFWSFFIVIIKSTTGFRLNHRTEILCATISMFNQRLCGHVNFFRRMRWGFIKKGVKIFDIFGLGSTSSFILFFSSVSCYRLGISCIFTGLLGSFGYRIGIFRRKMSKHYKKYIIEFPYKMRK